MCPLVTLALVDAVVGCCSCFAVRRQRRDRELLALVAVVLLGCAAVLGHLALPEPKAERMPPARGQVV